DDDVDLGVGRHRCRILVPTHRREIDPAIAAAVAGGDRGDNHSAAGALRQKIGLSVEQLQGAGADRAETRDSDLQWRLHEDDGNLRRQRFRQNFRSIAPKVEDAVCFARSAPSEWAQGSSSTSARFSPESEPDGAASTAILSEGIPAFVKAAAT